jgi:DNA-binding MarR family transcriptional regulator
VLSKWNRHDKKGHDLVVSWENPKKRVEKFVKLTHKGEKFIQEVKNCLR